MDHNSYKEQLSALLDGELNETERAAALAHLAECEECRAYFAELTAMHDALNDLDEAEPPADFAAGVLARLHEEAAPQQVKKVNPWRRWGALAACAAVIVLAVSALPGKGMGMKSSAPSSAEYATAAPSAPAPTETASAPAENYGFAGEANDGYAASDGAAAVTEAMLEMSQMKVQPAEDRADLVPNTALYCDGTKGYQGYAFTNGSGESECPVPESPAEGAAPTSPAPEPPADVSEPELPAEDSVLMALPPAMTAADLPELTLVGDGAAEWLAEHAAPLGGGLWLVSVEALDELPDTLELVGLQEPVDGTLIITFGTPENPQ